jgi:hypothetical protein
LLSHSAEIRLYRKPRPTRGIPPLSSPTDQLASSGERRKGAWEWHALLPVAWWKVLAVKLAVIVAAGPGAAACAWLVRLVLGGLPAGGGVAASPTSPATAALVVLGMLSVVCFTCLSGLFVGEPLLAVVSAVGWHLIWFALCGAAVIWLETDFPGLLRAEGGEEPNLLPWSLAATLIAGTWAIGVALLPGLFRRAWCRALPMLAVVASLNAVAPRWRACCRGPCRSCSCSSRWCSSAPGCAKTGCC